MNPRLTKTVAAVACAALLIPAAAIAKPGSGKTGKDSDKSGQGPSSGKGKSGSKSYNIDGTVSRIGAAESTDPLVTPDASTSDDVVVGVTGGNSRGRQFTGQSVTFDLSGAEIKVADTNGDGVRNLDDVEEGDRVKVKLRLPRDGSGSQPFAAERFEVKADEDDDGEEPEVVTP